MTQPNTQQVAAPELNAVVESAFKLASKLIQSEQDPDLLSVFSIARAHGYKVTSKFWHTELQDFVNAYEAHKKTVDAIKEGDVVVPFDSEAADSKS